MNFTQMHEHLRLELLRRIQRGTVSVSLLARQTGFGQAHLSNFLRSRRQLSLEAMDRILAVQHMTTSDLLSSLNRAVPAPGGEDGCAIPVVSYAIAMFEPVIRASAVQFPLHLPSAALQSMHPRTSSARRAWQRFVAVRVPPSDAQPMDPLLLPEAIALIDRHYTSLLQYNPERPNLYAVREGSQLTIRYVDFRVGRLVLRPHNLAYSVSLVEVGREDSPNDWLIGRVSLIFNEL